MLNGEMEIPVSIAQVWPCHQPFHGGPTQQKWLLESCAISSRRATAIRHRQKVCNLEVLGSDVPEANGLRESQEILA